MILAPIRKYYNYHKDADKHMNNLKNKWEELECRMMDIESKMGAELFPGKSPKEEVKFWLQKVETINEEIQNIEQEARGMCFSRMHVGKLACKKIQEVEELYQKGGFVDNLVVDPPVSHAEVLPTTTLVGESTSKRTMKKVWEHIIGEDFRKIGVYGMGGIGKTTVMKQINNGLLKETDKFDNVIWVTISKALNVFKLQTDIACKLNLDLSKYEDETTRAGKLNVALENRKRYVLILDDMWEAFRLEDIGIPEPTSTNGCKLVLTTRDVKVCDGMNCKNIKMELLSKEESWNLFLDTLGHDVLINNPNLKAIVEEVVKECARLPLAIIMIAGSLKNVVHASEWRNALEELRTSIKGPNNVGNAVFERLQFSYQRLKDEKLQHCLLYCALYPEDFQIHKDKLIEHLIDDEVIERMKSRQAEFDKGHTMLYKLQNACLLESGYDSYHVKLHDLIRDMALQIAGPKFMVGSQDFLDEEKWGKDLVKVSLMRNRKLEFPYISPMCPKLSTLLLEENEFVGGIPDSFFVHLHGLKVLHLSRTNITSLPNSVSDLANLTTLSLSRCRRLTHVPSLAKLTALRKLDLSGLGIEEIPHGVQTLAIYKCHNIRSSLDASFSKRAKELKSIYIRECEEIEDILSHPYTFPLQSLEIVELHRLDNLRIPFGEERVASAPAVTPGTFSCLKFFVISGCRNIKKLFTPGLLLNLGNLEKIDVYGCEQLEEIIGGVSDEVEEAAEEEIEEVGMGTTIFPKLRKLLLWSLPKLKTICSSSNVIVCDTLEAIMIRDCPKLKRLPLSLSLTNGKLSSPPSSLKIQTDKEWWELLEWDHPDMKNALEPARQIPYWV
uniref:Uncharacterized protein n=1 Tax=Fagus sylvatica TaxID=28930 RepID=A0A2N9H4D0_FAGSY